MSKRIENGNIITISDSFLYFYTLAFSKCSLYDPILFKLKGLDQLPIPGVLVLDLG